MNNKKIILKKIQRSSNENYGTALAARCWCICMCFRTYKPNMYRADCMLYAEGGGV